MRSQLHVPPISRWTARASAASPPRTSAYRPAHTTLSTAWRRRPQPVTNLWLSMRDQAGHVILWQGSRLWSHPRLTCRRRGPPRKPASVVALMPARIVEGFVAFDYEITMLIVSAVDGIRCCPPVGHIQVAGDYRRELAAGSDVGERNRQRLSPRALSVNRVATVSLVSSCLCVVTTCCSLRSARVRMTPVWSRSRANGSSEFALHARAILGLVVGDITLQSPGASVALLGQGIGLGGRRAGAAGPRHRSALVRQTRMSR